MRKCICSILLAERLCIVICYADFPFTYPHFILIWYLSCKFDVSVMNIMWVLWQFTSKTKSHVTYNPFESLSWQVYIPLLQLWRPSWPASLLLAGLTLWPNSLDRWLATLSMLSTPFLIPVGLSVPRRYTANIVLFISVNIGISVSTPFFNVVRRNVFCRRI